MERACVYVFLVLCLVQSIFCQVDCKLNFTNQPLSELPCRPTELTPLLLYCATSNSSINLAWFYTNNEDQAGINGTKIINPNSQGHIIDISYNLKQPRLSFMINNRTIGFYWCEVTDEQYSNVSVRSSTVTHIRSLNAYNNSSLNQCGSVVHLINSSIQCAIISISSSSTVLSPMPSSEASIQDSFSVIVTASVSSSISITPSMSSSFIYFALSTSPSFLVPFHSLSPSLSLSATTSSLLSFTPTPSLYPSPTTTGDTENNILILYALAGMCGLLAVIALVIVIAIFVLCYLTKHQSRRRSYTPKGQAGEDSSGVGRRDSVDEKASSHLPQQNTNNNINPSHLPPPPSHIQQQRGLSFSNPVYDIAKVQSSGSDSFDVFPPRIVPPDKPKTNSLPKYAKPDLSKKRSHSDEDYVSPNNTLPSGSDGIYDQVAVSPTGTSSTIGSRLPPPSEEPPELPPSLNLYDDPNQLSPTLNSPPAAYEEPHLTSPKFSSPPPPLLSPPPVEVGSALYDDPREVTSPSQQRPDSYMQPTSFINNIDKEEKENYYSMPVDAIPHKYHELVNMQASNQAETTNDSTSAENETAPDNSAAPQESAYDDPWGSMPTGIKRGSSRSSKSHGGRSHSINHSVSPNLFDDPQYDTPSPHQTTPIEMNNY